MKWPSAYAQGCNPTRRLYAAVVLAATLAGCSPFQSFEELSPRRFYLSKANDNLYSIAFAFQLRAEQLLHANPGIDLLDLAPGTRVRIPDEVAPVAYRETGVERSARGGKGFIWPLKQLDISSRFGTRRGRLHAGIDLRAPRGTAIMAAADGRVVFAGYNRGYGNMVVIDHGGGIETAYAHNNRNLVDEGQMVRQGQAIARVGRSGNATGHHVHFEFRRHGRALNPAQHVAIR